MIPHRTACLADPIGDHLCADGFEHRSQPQPRLIQLGNHGDILPIWIFMVQNMVQIWNLWNIYGTNMDIYGTNMDIYGTKLWFNGIITV